MADILMVLFFSFKKKYLIQSVKKIYPNTEPNQILRYRS